MASVPSVSAAGCLSPGLARRWWSQARGPTARRPPARRASGSGALHRPIPARHVCRRGPPSGHPRATLGPPLQALWQHHAHAQRLQAACPCQQQHVIAEADCGVLPRRRAVDLPPMWVAHRHACPLPDARSFAGVVEALLCRVSAVRMPDRIGAPPRSFSSVGLRLQTANAQCAGRCGGATTARWWSAGRFPGSGQRSGHPPHGWRASTRRSAPASWVRLVLPRSLGNVALKRPDHFAGE
jgi:hypothetical protein